MQWIQSWTYLALIASVGAVQFVSSVYLIEKINLITFHKNKNPGEITEAIISAACLKDGFVTQASWSITACNLLCCLKNVAKNVAAIVVKSAYFTTREATTNSICCRTRKSFSELSGNKKLVTAFLSGNKKVSAYISDEH